MTTERDRVLDRVADFLEPAPDALSALHRRIERRERTRMLGGVVIGGVLGVALIVALIAIGMRATSIDEVPADQPPVEIAHSDDSRAWSLFAVQTSDGASVTVGGPDRSMPIAVDVPADMASDGVAFTDQWVEGSRFIVGAVGAGVVTLSQLGGGPHADVPLYDVPFDHADFGATFIVPLDGGSTGWLVARDGYGEVIQTFKFAPGVTCGATTSCAGEDAVLISTADGTTYQVVLQDSGTIVLIDDLGVEHGRVSRQTSGPVEVARTDVTNRGRPVVLGVASAGFTKVQMIGPFADQNFDEVVDAPTATLPDGRLVFLAYQYAGYFVPHTFLISDAACSKSMALAYPSLEAVATPEIGACNK